MGVQVVKAEGQVPSETRLKQWFADQGLSPSTWGNGPGDRYGAHSHDYHKVLYCLSGSIEFHTDDGDLALEAGDRLDVEPGTVHSATVGSAGVRCIEAAQEA